MWTPKSVQPPRPIRNEFLMNRQWYTGHHGCQSPQKQVTKNTACAILRKQPTQNPKIQIATLTSKIDIPQALISTDNTHHRQPEAIKPTCFIN